MPLPPASALCLRSLSFSLSWPVACQRGTCPKRSVLVKSLKLHEVKTLWSAKFASKQKNKKEEEEEKETKGKPRKRTRWREKNLLKCRRNRATSKQALGNSFSWGRVQAEAEAARGADAFHLQTINRGKQQEEQVKEEEQQQQRVNKLNFWAALCIQSRYADLSLPLATRRLQPIWDSECE